MKTNSTQVTALDTGAGLLLEPFLGEVSGLKLQPANPFQWSEAPESSQSSQYLPHVGSHIRDALSDQKFCMYDARKYRKLLTVTGMYEKPDSLQCHNCQHPLFAKACCVAIQELS